MSEAQRSELRTRGELSLVIRRDLARLYYLHKHEFAAVRETFDETDLGVLSGIAMDWHCGAGPADPRTFPIHVEDRLCGDMGDLLAKVRGLSLLGLYTLVDAIERWRVAGSTGSIEEFIQ
jgi:hypothetical protein